jgi:hypothetical protein
MNAFLNFMTKAAELYLAAPMFFNWIVPTVVVAVGGLIWLAYWLGSKFAKAESDGLKAQIAALDQRFNFAKEQTSVAGREIEGLRAELQKLKEQIAHNATALELQNSTAILDGKLNRALSANTASSDALSFRSVGFDKTGQLVWEPITRSSDSR